MHQMNLSVSDNKSIDETYESNVKVFVRILPLEKICDSYAKINADSKTIYVRCLQDLQREKQSMGSYPMYWVFRTNGIFHETSQEKVYHATAKDFFEKYHFIFKIGNDDIPYCVSYIINLFNVI
ncbi:uncharacterized protein LOC112553035 [Pogonomyrmex barbatus]|uniref:Uncharacterized protein LOC112553035 n=1 Tax=Pogonomyrmex barbatus TaxID=144034 RepID=A0A8N1SBP8_9HYME|nr:uncharacterized protein LOC112553035 [Pogonomyrmex barbatus]